MKKLVPVLILFTVFASAQEPSNFEVISTFNQNDANNCASVALIKAAMYKFGYKNMFTELHDQGSYQITLKDGKKLTVSDAELTQAKDQSRFEVKNVLPNAQRDEVMHYAYLAYACIAKFIEKNGYWDCEERQGAHISPNFDYAKALRFISRKSYCTDYCYRLLGFKIDQDKIFDFTNPVQLVQPGTILYSEQHAVAAYNDLIDCHGDWISADIGKSCYNFFEWYIILK